MKDKEQFQRVIEKIKQEGFSALAKEERAAIHQPPLLEKVSTQQFIGSARLF